MKKTYSHIRSAAARFFAAAIAVLTLVLPVAARAAQQAYPASVSYQMQYSGVLNHLYNGGAPVFGSVGGEWKMLVLARSGRVSSSSNYATSYYKNIEAMVKAKGSNMLDPSKSTENSRLIIALTSIGFDARKVAGYDLTAPLSDFNYVKKQGINGAIFALIALNTNTSYGMSSTKKRCIDYILNAEIAGGGWAFAGNNADPDITAMAISALSGYVSSNQNVKNAVDRGVSKLSSLQSADGAFASFGTKNAESCAQVIIALSSLKINASTDQRFVKNNKSVVDALLSFYKNSGFEHTAGSGVNAMASEQSAMALCAFDRFSRGRNALYNMNDTALSIGPGEAETTPQPGTTDTPISTQPPAQPTVPPTAVPTLVPTSVPTDVPTSAPTDAPTGAPSTNKPTSIPTSVPTATPTPRPTSVPTSVPTATPTPRPTSIPTSVPTSVPTGVPTSVPTDTPTDVPATDDPSASPDAELTDEPTLDPSADPSEYPSFDPTPVPVPTERPSVPDITIDPIDIDHNKWNGGGSDNKIKWILPAVCGGALIISGIVLLIYAKKRQ